MYRRLANLRLDLNRIRRASLTLNEASVYTSHGFCSQVLASHNIAIGVPSNLAIETDQSADLVRIAEDLFRLHVLSLPSLEQEVALSIWKSPETMRQSLAALLSRSTLTVHPRPHVTELPERLAALMQEIKASWINQDLCSVIETSDLMRSRKAYKQRHLMTQLAEGAALCHPMSGGTSGEDPPLQPSLRKAGNHPSTPSSLCLMTFTSYVSRSLLQSRARGKGMASIPHRARKAKFSRGKNGRR